MIGFIALWPLNTIRYSCKWNVICAYVIAQGRVVISGVSGGVGSAAIQLGKAHRYVRCVLNNVMNCYTVFGYF
ncbi:hypothetical protein EGC86_19920 [Shewanella frigidimarina]|nr:hypothetical protein EGC86_19920 [Shewanella frigidimarina]